MSNLPIFFQLLIASFVMALIFSAVWVYLVPEKYHQQPSQKQQEEDQETDNTPEAIKARRQAQERLVTQLAQTKQLRQQRQAMNNQPYPHHRLPSDLQTLTLSALFDQADDVFRGAVYLQTGDNQTISPDRFNEYWHKPDTMLWAWQGDNILEDYGETSLKELMREHYAQIKASLLVSGWQLLGENQTDYNLISCYTRKR